MAVTRREQSLSRTTLFSEELGIRLASGSDPEIFKWFLASSLFGARITQTIAKNTYHAFERHGLVSPSRIIEAGWDYLVNPIMREGGYVRYDGRKSTQILRDCEKLLEDYHGSLLRLHHAARKLRIPLSRHPRKLKTSPSPRTPGRRPARRKKG